MSASLAILHMLIGFACLTRDGFAKCVNEGAWGLKILGVMIMWVGMLFIPSNYFDYYATVA